MLKRFFITWVTHNSRYSERMKLYKVEKQEWFFLDFDDRVLMYDLIFQKLLKKWKKNFTLNVLSDHVHMVILYEEEKLSKFIWKIKWGVSFEFSRVKRYSEQWFWKWNRIWAKWFSKTFLNTDEHYEKAIDYTLENHKKHKIENIYH